MERTIARESKKTGEKKKKKKKEKAKGKKKAAKEARDEKRKKKKKKKSGKRGIERLETDKGPFGMGESRKMRKTEGEEEDSDSEETSSSQSFHKAPSGLTLHLRLQRYAMKHPGRLATRLLQRMEKVCRLGGGVPKTGTGVQGVRPCALAYFLTILTPSLKDRWSPRTQRELRVLTEVLDHLAEDAGSKAADVIAQRIKALEQSVQDGKCLEEGEVPRASGARRGDFSGSRRVEYDAEGGGAGGEVPGQGSMEDVGPEPSEGRQRKERRKRQREVRWQENSSPGGSREERRGEAIVLLERVDADTPFLRVPATLKPAEPMANPRNQAIGEEIDDKMPGDDPEMAEAEVSSRATMEMKVDFQQSLINALKQPMKLGDVSWEIHRLLPSLKTPLGMFRSKLEEHAVALEGADAPFDLLPISVAALETLPGIPERYRDWVALIGLVLSFHYCSGFSEAKYLRHPTTLTKIQERMALDHLCPAVKRLLEGDPDLVAMKEVRSELDRKGHDYDGSTWVKMEELNFEKVISCWPSKEQAAVAPVTKFVTGDTLEQIKNPMSSILPEEEWPAELPRSYVRASDEEWSKLVKEGYQRGLFHHCPDGEVLKRSDGTPVVNGAGAVPKLKNGELKQRFISILCPLNAVSKKIEGSEGALPYVGQISLLQIPEESEVGNRLRGHGVRI